jgi:hypothetical protein
MYFASSTAAPRQASVAESAVALPPVSVESRHAVSHALNPRDRMPAASTGQHADPNMPLLRRHHAAPPYDPKTWSAFGTVHLRLSFLRIGRIKGSSQARGMRPPHYGGPPCKIRDVDFIVPARVNAARLMPRYFANYSQKRDLIRRIRWQRRTELHGATDWRFR